MSDLSSILLSIMTAETLDQAASSTLQALVNILPPQAACVLLWDSELGRYIVGDTWQSSAQHMSAADVRRNALHYGKLAYELDPSQSRCIVPEIFYQPLNFQNQHVGAYVCLGLDRLADPTDESYERLMRGVSRTLYSVGQFQQATQEQAQAQADRERLEKLLQAVEQQQRTIDRLLAAERQFSASLEAKVEERTTALRLAQERLIQSEKLAVIGKLASSLAHELNNPLQAVQSGLGLVMAEIESGDRDVARQDLRIIQVELERVESIFRQMLDFYRPVSYEYAPLDLNAICDGVRVLMRKRLQETNVSLRLELGANLPLSCGDGNQIKQVLLNLTLNAAEALAAGGGNIWLRTTTNGKHVCVSVNDDGPGIPPQYRARLFEPLFTTKTRGLGLGLAISQELMQRHGGAITVESMLGTGTTFTIHLPIKEGCHERPSPPGG
jgi:signal transduction histidine kinase